jgi:GTP-binding protein EngB required for normal cell division
MNDFYQAVSSTVSSTVSTIVNRYNQEPVISESNIIIPNQLGHLNNNEVLKIGNLLSAIFSNQSDIIEVPRLAVVGTQSSGKSTLLNAILGMDIMPTGSNMVTRTPLNLQLVQIDNPSDRKAEFGYYQGPNWVVEHTVQLSAPPTSSQIAQIRQAIDKETNKRAGVSKNVSMNEILLKISSPEVPNLSLIDLPGLTMVACTDQGQPQNIKEQISDMIGKYIESSRCIILAVLPARSDLETDPALELIKKHDPKGERTLGVLTKVDLMNQGTDISSYLTGDISRDLQFRYGYYAVRNRSSHEIEIESKTISEGYHLESQFFDNHQIYSRLDRSRMGVKRLSESLSNILIDHIKVYLPNVLQELSDKRHTVQTQLDKMGTSTPSDFEGQSTLVHMLLGEFSNQFKKAIDERGNNYNIGRDLKEILSDYRDQIKKIAIFNRDQYSDEYLTEIVKNYDGNHMSTGVFPIEVLEYCLKDNQRRPMKMLLNPSLQCIQKVIELLQNLVDQLTNSDQLSRYPKLTKRIQDIFKNELVYPNQTMTQNRIVELVELEEYYIWTENPEFMEVMTQSYRDFKVNRIEPEIMRKLLKAYLETVKTKFTDQLPKIIMYYLIRHISNNLYSDLCEKLGRTNNQNEKVSYGLMLEEDPGKQQVRIDLVKKRDSIVSAIQLIRNII